MGIRYDSEIPERCLGLTGEDKLLEHDEILRVYGVVDIIFRPVILGGE